MRRGPPAGQNKNLRFGRVEEADQLSADQARGAADQDDDLMAAAPEVPQPLVQQLARTGIMVLPIGSGDRQRLARVRRVGTGVQIEDCGTAEFVPLVGRYGWKE